MTSLKLGLLVLTLLIAYARCQNGGSPTNSRLERAQNRLRGRLSQLQAATTGPSTAPPPTTTTTTGPTTTHMDEGVTTAINKHGNVEREPLTRSQVNRAQVAIRKLVNDNRTPAGHHPFNAGILRLSFHDCVGLLGCDGCINHFNRANSGVAFYAMQLDKLWDLQFKHAMSQADFWSLAGITVTQFAMELNPNCHGEGCVPDIPFFYGRNDCGVSQFFMHEFCPIHDDAAPFFQKQFNLNKEEYTTLMGAHTLGRVNTHDGDTWDRTPDYFDNNYYVQLADKANKWKRANRTSVPELNESWTNVNGSLLMLGSDIAIISNLSDLAACNPDPMRPNCPPETTRSLVERYAADNKLFLKNYAEVYGRILHKSPFKLHPIVEDTHHRPRWERPGTLPTFAPTTTTTTATTTTPAPIVRGTTKHVAEFDGAKFCEFTDGVICPFLEQMTFDHTNLQIVSGHQNPYGPRAGKLGKYFMVMRGNLRDSRKTARIKVKQFKGVSGCLHLSRYQAGPDSGKLTVYRAYGGWYPGNVIRSTDSRDITTDWVYEQYSLDKYEPDPTLSHEMIIEVEAGSSGIIAIDDIIFDDQQSC